MKRILLFTIMLAGTLSVKAQFTKLDRHPVIPVEYDAVFVDHVRNFVGGVIRSSYGQFFGQITPQGELTGYGTFYTDRDGEIVGQFYNGQLIVGIKQGNDIVKVGTETHYAVYDLRTAELLYIMKDGEKYLPDADHKEAWKYGQLKYANGGKYVGELVNGKRDGFGIYYYADGDHYFGRYSDNRPVGYGAMFKTDNSVVIQKWENKSEE